MKQNKDFNSLPASDAAELLETNVMVATIISSLELYSNNTHSIAWPLTEQDYRALSVFVQSDRASVDLDTIIDKIETELSDDMAKLTKYYQYLSHIGPPTAAVNILAVSTIFSPDYCTLDSRQIIEEIRRRYLILLFECLSYSEGVVGACKMGLRLHTAIQHITRICQQMMQKFVTVQE